MIRLLILVLLISIWGCTTVCQNPCPEFTPEVISNQDLAFDYDRDGDVDTLDYALWAAVCNP